MIYLLLSILCSTLIVVVFRMFPKFQVNTFQAIVVNYFVCVVVGALMLGRFPFTADSFSSDWMPYAAGLGVFFISGFYAVGMTVTLFGLTVASVLQKMSLVISVPFAILMFSEAAPAVKIIGLIMALAAVILTNWPNKKKDADDRHIERKTFLEKGGSLFLLWFFPIYAYIVSGGIEVGLQFVQGTMIAKDDSATANEFTSAIFASAGIIGLIVVLIQTVRGKMKLAIKNLWAGILLGIPNYFSIVFLILAFNWWDKSVVLPVNNIAVVSLTALIGFFIFRERLSAINISGVLLAVMAILLISWNSMKSEIKEETTSYIEELSAPNRACLQYSPNTTIIRNL
jgi:drug/metabolite transporter (DMT)-like permease